MKEFFEFAADGLTDATSEMGIKFTANGQDYEGVFAELQVTPTLGSGGYSVGAAQSLVVPIAAMAKPFRAGQKIILETGKIYKIARFDRSKISYTYYLMSIDK